MITLAVDTSSSRGSLSIFDLSKSEPIAETHWHREKSHSEVLLGAYQSLLKEAGMDPSQIEQYAVGVGPGSFTGIRVGVNFVRSLAYSYDKPSIQMDSLRLLAEEGLSQDLPCLCLVNAFKNLVYCAGFKKNGAEVSTWLEPKALSLNELSKLIQTKVQCLGNGYQVFSPYFDSNLKQNLTPPGDNQIFPRAESLAKYISAHQDATHPKPWREVKPLYIRASEAEEKLGKN